MEIGRNIEFNKERNTYAVVVRYQFEGILRRWNFDTHRKAMRKFNELKKQADWLPIREDVTL